jgi:hypothetical protein
MGGKHIETVAVPIGLLLDVAWVLRALQARRSATEDIGQEAELAGFDHGIVRQTADHVDLFLRQNTSER